MKRSLERQEEGSAVVIPILVRPVDWQNAPFAYLQPLPTDALPLASWQNEDMALADVAGSIRSVIRDMPLIAVSAPRAALPAIWSIPHPRNPFFVGRNDELARVHDHLKEGRTLAVSQPQAISGLGGIGKTQFALEYAYRYHQNYQAVLWARAESAEALISSYITIATLLRLPEHKAREQEVIIQAIKTWLQIHHDWLLILDNADELALLPDFLPPSLGGHLLLTTRAAATGRLARKLEIETLPPEQAALLLLRRAGFIESSAPLEQASPHEQELARHISQELGGLPLALDQAGAYLEESGTDLAEYWLLYQRHRADLLQERRGLVADYPASVATTWLLSFQKVEEKSPAAADLLRLSAFLSPDAIPEEMLTGGASLFSPVLSLVAADAFLFNQAIETLRACSLVQRDRQKKTLSVHRLVQAVLEDRLSEAEKHAWAELAILVVNATFPQVEEYGAWPQCERLLSQAVKAARLIESYHIVSQEAGRLLFETALYLRDRARYSEAEPLFQQALRIREQHLGPEHPDVASLLNNWGNLYYQQGKYEKAEPLLKQALRIREQHLGPEHPDVARLLSNLANLYAEQGKYEQAEPFMKQVLRIREQHLGPEHPDIAASLNNLGLLYLEMGKYEQAELLTKQALSIWMQRWGPDHQAVAYSLNNLANVYRVQGKYEQAESFHRRALHIREQQLGTQHPDVAYSLTGLADLYRVQGNAAEAAQLYQRALSIREQALEASHPETAETLHGLATLREAHGSLQEAVSFYQRALVIREKVFGPHHSKTKETRERLQTALAVLGRAEDAARLNGG